MSFKGHTKFTIAGRHPLLYLVRDYLILKGFALVPWDGEYEPDFCIIGAEIKKGEEVPFDELYYQFQFAKKYPVVLLSSSHVYSDRRVQDLKVAPKEPMQESQALMVPSPTEAAASRTVYSIAAEHMFLNRSERTLVVRPFNVYGPDITWDVVNKFILSTKQHEPLELYGSGYQTRTFLHQDDFFEGFYRLLNKFMKGTKGIYNIGTFDEISIKRLADSVWQLTHGQGMDTLTCNTQAPFPFHQWKLPNIEKIKKVTSWKPKISLRTGLFRLIV